MSMSSMKRPAAWQVRKIAYGLVAVVVGVLGWVGWVDESTGEKIGEQVMQIIPWVLGVLAPAVAASKTHAGSDSTATDEDRDAADRAALQARSARGADVVLDRLAGIPDAVLAAIRAEERGEHVTVTDPAAAASAAQTARDNAAQAAAPGVPASADTKSVAAYYAGE